MSSHAINVLEVTEILPHPNADALGIVKVGGYQCCVALKDWQPRVPCLAAYIPPDSVVKTTRPEFSFLDDGKGTGTARIRVKRLRGVYSQGLLVLLDGALAASLAGAQSEVDLSADLEVTHYEPPLQMNVGDAESPPDGVHAPVYDVENYNKFPTLIAPGTLVVATEKIHGTNARYTYAHGRLWCGSRQQWRKEGDNPYWIAAKQTPAIEAYLKDRPGTVLYGEVYGKVQNLRYGLENKVAFAAFDILEGGRWLPFEQRWRVFRNFDIPAVPHLFNGDFDEAALRALAEGNTTIEGAKHIREGIVIEPVVPEFSPEIGRVKLKMVSNAYLEKN